MKKIVLLTFLCSLLVISAACAAPVVDGVFGLTEWAGHYTNDDGVLDSQGYLNPGYGGQAYDVEYTGLYLTESTLYFGIQAGYDFTGTGLAYAPGDFGFDVTGDGYYDYAVDYSISGNDVTYSLIDMSTASWEGTDPALGYDSLAGPWQANYTGSDILNVWSMSGAFGSANNLPSNTDGGMSYILEGSLPMSWLASYTGGVITDHWTMECGNDVGQHSAAPVPEPATMLLTGIGLMFIGATGRKKFKKR